jgi:heptaprenylglyceryl phosphate synthase
MYKFCKNMAIIKLLNKQLKLLIVLHGTKIKNCSTHVSYVFIIFFINLYNYLWSNYKQCLSYKYNTRKVQDFFVRKKGYIIVELCSLALILHQFW